MICVPLIDMKRLPMKFGVSLHSTTPLPNTGYRAIAAGDSHSLAMLSGGSIVAWGSNENGQLDVPAPNTGYLAMAAGLLHNLALSIMNSQFRLMQTAISERV